jgi:hypothetical protein
VNTVEFINQFAQLHLQITNSLTSTEGVRKSKDKLYNFLDMNYETYIISNSEERNEIREFFKKIDKGRITKTFLDHFLLGYIQRCAENIELGGEKVWLVRGLVVNAIEDGILDHRDNVNVLAYLFVAANDKGLDPKIEYQKIAEIVNNEPSLEGSKPMSQIILEIPDKAYKINEERKKFL